MLRWCVPVWVVDPLHGKSFTGDFYVYAERERPAELRALAAAEQWARSNLPDWQFRDDYDRLPQALINGTPVEAPLMREA